MSKIIATVKVEKTAARSAVMLMATAPRKAGAMRDRRDRRSGRGASVRRAIREQS